MRYGIVFFTLISASHSRYIGDEKSKGSHFYETKPLGAFTGGIESLSRAVELPLTKDIDNSESDWLTPRESVSSIERPFVDEFGTVITYPDKQLLDINDNERDSLQRSDFAMKHKSEIQQSQPGCIPRSEQGELTSESAEETAVKEAADELLSPVHGDVVLSKQSTKNFTGPELIEEPFILITIRPLCPD
uniref:Seminal fluid protein n=1 Tax=Ascaris lumbricoides TaxID=6252 RepID=A0A0M3HXS6_ASCLU